VAPIGLGIVAAVALLWLWGWTRPVGHVARAAVPVLAPPEAVWAVIVDYARHGEWRTGVSGARRTGDRVEEADENGDVLAYVVETEDAPRVLSTRIVEQSMFGGTWTITLTPTPAGTTVEIVERGEIYSPLFRALAPLFHDPEATARTWLADLERRVASR
jgi:Polyketide cyclase / dehydrase and lipid transport